MNADILAGLSVSSWKKGVICRAEYTDVTVSSESKEEKKVVVAQIEKPAPKAAVEAQEIFNFGLNFSDDDLNIDGYKWFGMKDAAKEDIVLANGSVYKVDSQLVISPAADPDTEKMLKNGFVCKNAEIGKGFDITKPIKNGKYNVYLWDLEDEFTHSRNMDVFINGTKVDDGIGYLLKGGWQRYGPYMIQVTDEIFKLNIKRESLENQR